MFMRVAILVFLGMCNAAVFGKMIWGPTGILEYRELKQQYRALQENIANLDAENMALSRDIRLLQSDKQYMEKMIRQRLHYMRDNETVYIFASPTAGRTGAMRNDGKN